MSLCIRDSSPSSNCSNHLKCKSNHVTLFSRFCGALPTSLALSLAIPSLMIVFWPKWPFSSWNASSCINWKASIEQTVQHSHAFPSPQTQYSFSAEAIFFFLSSPENVSSLLLEKEGRREGGRERNINVREKWLVAFHTHQDQGSHVPKLGILCAWTGDEPATLVCALTKNGRNNVS